MITRCLILALVAVLLLDPARAAQPPNPMELLPQGVGLTTEHYASAATTNSTLVAAGSHVVYNISWTNTNATTAYLKLYNKATAPNCNSDPVKRVFMMTQNVPQAKGSIFGQAFPLGVGFCITGGIADDNNSAATTGISVDIDYK